MDLHDLPGAADVINWFGYMPTFHDAEVIELRLRRGTDSTLLIHFWHTTNELDEQGQFVRDKNAVVAFSLEEVTDLDLTEFGHQNVISGLELEQVDGGLQLTLLPSFGLSGTITAKEISVKIIPRTPC